MSKITIIYFLVSIAGILLAAFGFKMLFKTLNYLYNGILVEGEVIQLEQSSDSDGTYYLPVFRFMTLDHKQVIIKGKVKTNPIFRKVGEKVEILYFTDHPEKAVVKSFMSIFGHSFILFSLSFPFLLYGFGYFLTKKMFLII